MCLAVPLQVALIESESVVRCRVGEGDNFLSVSTQLLPDQPVVGDYLIIHAGFAMRKLDPQDAEETLKLMREMVAANEAAQ
ncbi:HypC/HybG/HupF family hydrogenase formation chaperone [Desulfovibrio litoralis]|uniref:Hydrogenase expression/formation protein HypC n=1 Tax=Desulfovibrio litoralis DSM 11393 TaxID=1121455 RepID=A0A1M7ST91_9BACT|nr:HypC/HybG/HupF family hydrogenase formation chaperone [Desulfovibrio litoralis]SHN61725.1 hydrogenase expression/formation protein HypC [Desulfovibrio litoralis DSM 11393]